MNDAEFLLQLKNSDASAFDKLMKTFGDKVFNTSISMLQNTELAPMEKMEQLIDQYILKLTNQQCFHRIMVREQMTSNNEFIAGQIHALKIRNQALIKQLIEDGQAKRVFKQDIDIPLMMMTMFGTVSQLVTTQHFYKETNGLQSLTEEEFQQHIRTKLSQHLKKIFKAILLNEE